MRIKKVQERWFPAENDPDGAEVFIKELTPGEIQDIQECHKRKISYVTDEAGNLKPDLSFTPETSLELKLTFEKCVLDWKNFFDADGNALPFNKENLIRAMREIDGFNAWVVECRGVLTKDITEEKKGQEKNLSSSAAG